MQRPPGRPWVIAHRGASRVRRENTLEAFRHAVALGADAVELDTRCTADGEIVVHHDDTVPRIGPIIGITGTELRARASWIPTLTEALDTCAGIWMNIEVKNAPGDHDWDPADEVVGRIVTIIRDAGAAKRVLLSSFNAVTVGKARPGLATGWVIEAPIPVAAAITEAASLGFDALHPSVADLAGDAGPEAIAAAHAAELLLICWTLDEPEEMQRLAAAGIDGIITNVPDVARSALGEHGHHDRG